MAKLKELPTAEEINHRALMLLAYLRENGLTGPYAMAVLASAQGTIAAVVEMEMVAHSISKELRDIFEDDNDGT